MLATTRTSIPPLTWRPAAPCRNRGTLGHYHAVLRRPTLLVIDELGYLPLPAEAASALFQVVSHRYLKTGIAFFRRDLTTTSSAGCGALNHPNQGGRGAFELSR